MKKYITTIFLLFIFIATGANLYANISSVKYIHDTIYNQKSVMVPITGGAQPDRVSNLHYLMAQIDSANTMLNGCQITDYANNPEFTTNNVVAKEKADTSIQNLINQYQNTAFVISATNVAAFSFSISASGNFKIAWGDGKCDIINKTNTTATTYSHTYATRANYDIKLVGLATGYNANSQIAAISFENETRAFKIAGNIGRIFPTISPTQQPSFYFMFRMASGLSGTIPAGMFDGVYGEPVAYMFADIFNGTNLSGQIPDGLFSGISGAYKAGIFQSAFNGLIGLTGPIPANLFGTLSGPPAEYIFANTFYGCTGLTGDIPRGLFGAVSGPARQKMFIGTFYQNTGLTGLIPAGLFGTLTGAPGASMFTNTFFQCRGISGFEDGIWDLTGVTKTTTDSTIFASTFQGCTGMTTASPTIAAGNSTKLWTNFNKITTTMSTFKNATVTDIASVPGVWKN